MRLLLLTLFTFPLALTAQQPLQPCAYGLPCINPGGSQDVLPHPDNQLARVIEGVDPDQGTGPLFDIHRCDRVTGDARSACNFLKVHGCRSPRPNERYGVALSPGAFSLVARTCGWK